MKKSEEIKYFIYARKSSESEERQSRSIDDQLSLLWKQVKQSGLKVIEEFTESQTARYPGRPVFDEMMKRIVAGEANGILVYHPDRLARNAVDGGKIIYLLDTGKLQNLLFDNFMFDKSPNGKLNLHMAFGYSKYYTDNLSEVIRRGINSKLERGIYPNWAKRGYINHPKTREIIPDPEIFNLIKKMFELYASGIYSFAYLGQVMHEKGLRNNSGTALSGSQVQRMIKDPFYYGHFIYSGELYEGIHQPCITRELYKKAQAVMKNKGKSKKRHSHSFTFTGMILCNECGHAITAQKQKGHVYYNCTKRSKTQKCNQPYIREEELDKQFREIMNLVALPGDWLDNMLSELDSMTWETESRESEQLAVLDSESKSIQAKISRLADLYIEGEMDRADYLARKENLLEEKVALLERRKKVLNTTDKMRFELMREPLMVLQDWNSGVAGGDLKKLRELVSEVGLNFKLNSRKLLHDWLSPYQILASRGVYSDWR